MNPLEFERVLTEGDYVSPILPQIVSVHSIMYHSGVRGDAMAVAEHLLREMFANSAQYRGAYEQLTPARLDADWAQRFQKQVKEAFSGMQATLEGLRAKQTPEARERARDARLKRQIAEERRKGLAFVKAEGRRVEKELGL